MISSTLEPHHPDLDSSCVETEQLKVWVEHAAHYLPSQGPIEVFVHHNTLHAFEDLPFCDAVLQAMSLYGHHPYLTENRYREEFHRDRIQKKDLAAIINADLKDQAGQGIGNLGSRVDLRLAMLESRLHVGPPEEVHWLLSEGDALRKFREEVPASARLRLVEDTRRIVLRDYQNGSSNSDPQLREAVGFLIDEFGRRTMTRWTESQWEGFTLQLLWQVCRWGVEKSGSKTFVSSAVHKPTRIRDLLLKLTGEDPDKLVHSILIPFTAAFLDQGYAQWSLPDRSQGFYQAFINLFKSARPIESWQRGLAAELKRLETEEIDVWTCIDESLSLLGLPEQQKEHLLQRTLLALPGWAGMIWQMETNAEWTVRPAPAETLAGFLAIHLLLDRIAASHIANEHGYDGPLESLRDRLIKAIPTSPPMSQDQSAFLIFQLAQVRGWAPFELAKLEKAPWKQLFQEVRDFSSVERRRVFHLAYERRYRNQTLDALIAHNHQVQSSTDVPSFQIVTCIDDREESLRRHIEEIDPQSETFGAAGFYAVAMYYKSAADAHFRPLCPNIIKPQHYVLEDVTYSQVQAHRRRSETRKALGTVTHRWHSGSRTFLGGIVTGLFGSLASIPMVTRILFPRATAQWRKLFGQFIQPPPLTDLHLLRLDDPPQPEFGHYGYTTGEMANIVERILRDIGLTSKFSRIIIFTGHGSSSLNNPHESAYNCGACSGGRGGPNARAFCRMANDPKVRRMLWERGLEIPDETIFVGAYHNTCDDSVTFSDLDRIPMTHIRDFDRVSDVIAEACQRDAHERCRRFESADVSITPVDALHHVESRSEDLSQARPEYNHATNALCIVGRRQRTQGLFLDRRAFLTSYDPHQDDEEHSILLRILQAAVPVCAGISLEYYFSTVDVTGYGCGSKLPHNITSLLGVMEGATSDLRPGLSAQMVEIHEPMRILFIIEATAETMHSIMDRSDVISRLIKNEWVQLALQDPDSSKILLFTNGEFRPYEPETHEVPVVSSSKDWYRGWRHHLGFATISPTAMTASPTRPVETESAETNPAESQGARS